MAYKGNEVKAGIMIIISLVILGVFLAVIFGLEFGEDAKEYRLRLQYVGGITKGSLVKFQGMDVGQVKEITLPADEETRIDLQLEVTESTPVKVDSRAFVSSIGIMADQHIEITAGSRSAEQLPAGSEIASKNVLSFAQMSEAMGDLNAQVQELLSRVSDMLSEENAAHLASVIGNIDTLIQEGREPFLTTAANLAELSGQLADVSKDINKIMDKNEGNLNEILSNLKATTEATNQLISGLRTTTGNLESLVSANTSSLIEIVENFQLASQNLEEFTRMLKEQPWLLVRKSAPPEREY